MMAVLPCRVIGISSVPDNQAWSLATKRRHGPTKPEIEAELGARCRGSTPCSTTSSPFPSTTTSYCFELLHGFLNRAPSPQAANSIVRGSLSARCSPTPRLSAPCSLRLPLCPSASSRCAGPRVTIPATTWRSFRRRAACWYVPPLGVGPSVATSKLRYEGLGRSKKGLLEGWG